MFSVPCSLLRRAAPNSAEEYSDQFELYRPYRNFRVLCRQMQSTLSKIVYYHFVTSFRSRERPESGTTIAILTPTLLNVHFTLNPIKTDCWKSLCISSQKLRWRATASERTPRPTEVEVVTLIERPVARPTPQERQHRRQPISRDVTTRLSFRRPLLVAPPLVGQ